MNFIINIKQRNQKNFCLVVDVEVKELNSKRWYDNAKIQKRTA